MTLKRPRTTWSTRAGGLILSIGWHALVLAVLVLAVHPLPLPHDGPPIVVELIPPLPTTPLPVLRRLPEDEPTQTPIAPQPAPKPQENPPVLRQLTETPQPPAPAEPAPQTPIQIARPQPALSAPAEIQRRSSPAPPKLTQTVQAPAPVAPQPVEQPAPTTAPPAPAPLQVLTNDRAIQAPVAIKPPERRALSVNQTAPDVPQPVQAESGGGGGGAAAGAQAGAGIKPFDGQIVGFEKDGIRWGLRMRLGCENPDTYHLSPEEKAECLRRLAEQAKAAAAMGPNIPEAKQALYDRQQACHAATTSSGIPSSTSQSDATGKILGLGANARLRDCGPGDR